MQTVPVELEAKARFSTVDAALRWVSRTSDGSPRSLDLSAVSLGRDAARFTRDEQIATRSTVLAMIGQLPRDEQIAIAMRAAGHSYREISERLGYGSHKTALRRVDAARSKLGDRLRERGLMLREVA